MLDRPMSNGRLLPLPPLHALRAFHAAAHFGQFREAAAALGLSESAVSHQVRKLETYLGVHLFERAGNRVSLTAAGKAYFDEIDPAFVRVRNATDTLRGPRDRTRVSLTLSGSLATMWLIPRLARLEAAHPDVSLQLTTTVRLCDLRKEQIDLAIRYGTGPWPGLTVQHLLNEQAFPVCTPGFLSVELVERPQEALRRARLIVNDTDMEEWQSWSLAHGLEPPSLKGAIVLHASDQTLGAAIEGLGLAIGRRPLVDRMLDEGRLIAPFGSADPSGCAYYLVHPEEVELTVAARKVSRWLIEFARSDEPELVLR
jgi:LysR family glycine cleavage system transcriptional activator